MNDYLDSVREVERRIQKAEAQNAQNAELPALDRPDGIPPTFEEHIQLMYDLMTIAFQADITRVITLMYSREARATGPIVPSASRMLHHGLSHHMNDPAKMARLQLIDHHRRRYVQLLPGQDEGGERRRGNPAGSFDDRIRKQPERLQPPSAISTTCPCSCGAGGGWWEVAGRASFALPQSAHR